MNLRMILCLAWMFGTLTMTGAAAGDAPSLRLEDGPILLHANLDQQWGGHTFAYLLEGEDRIYWSATAYNPDGKTWASVVGQYPKPGSAVAPAVTTLPLAGDDVRSLNQPILLRSGDGHIHVIIGSSRATADPNYSPGEIRYYRSAEPGDISTLVDRSERIPRVGPYNEYHLRMNAAVSRDGTRAAIVILAISKDGSVPFNTPVIFFGEQDGPDFAFREPIKYAEPMGFFYPQLALTDHGTVVVGQVWDNYERSITRLLHLDAGGAITHRADLPADTDGNYWCLDLRPAKSADWNDLVVYYNKYPKGGEDCRHEFWTYSAATTTLRQHRSIPVPEGQINYGKWIPVGADRSLLLHNPSMGAFRVLDGNLLGEGDYGIVPLPETNPASLGYVGTAYTFVPNPLQGSVNTPGSVWFASDYIPHKNNPDERIRGAMLLYRLRVHKG